MLDPRFLLGLFLALRLVQFAAERALARVNRRAYLDPVRQAEAKEVLKIADDDFAKTLAYTSDKFQFGAFHAWYDLVVTLVFLAVGGLGLAEAQAKTLAAHVDGGPLLTGVLFFLIVGFLSMIANLPWEYRRVFTIEAKHGFNRQTVKGFWLDRLKGLGLSAVLGGPLLFGILWIMQSMGDRWWVFAWALLSAYSLLTAWIFPTFLAPLFNKFSPLGEGDLKVKIEALATAVGFHAGGVFVMDASKRSSHGNAYFTGVFGKKRIVLFDTLVSAMAAHEVVAVLAHELGHFKLHHVRWNVIRGILMTGVMFYALSLCLPLDAFYRSFELDGVSNYGALIVFGLWFGALDLVLSPLSNWVSRQNEFAADRFAKKYGGGSEDLTSALLKLREVSHAMPISHPIFSAFYHSHPPLLERLGALRT